MTDVHAVPRAVRALGRQLAAIERTVRDMAQADQADARAVTDGALDVYDDDGNLRGRVGKQADGSFGLKSFAPTPQVPTEPDVIPVPGGCIVEWDGTFEDAQEEPVQRIAIHVGTDPAFEVNTDDDEESDGDSTEKAAILSPRGGSAFIALDPGQETYYIRLTAVAEGGLESEPTDAVEATIAAPEAAFWQDEVTLGVPGSQTFELTYEPMDNSEHLYWNGLYQREDAAWTRIGQTVTLTGSPFPPQPGDRVVVEYAFLPGEQPEKQPLDGTAYRFADGAEPYFYCGPTWNRLAPFTITALVKLRANPGAERVLFHQGGFPGWKNTFTLAITPGGALRLELITSAGPLEFYPNGVADGVGGALGGGAAHIAMTVESQLGLVYVNGTEVLSVEIPPDRTLHAYHHDSLAFANFYLGASSPPIDLDEPAIFNRRLTETEIDAQVRAWEYGTYPSTIMGQGAAKYGRLDDPLNAGYIPTKVGGGFSWYGDPGPISAPALQKGQ